MKERSIAGNENGGCSLNWKSLKHLLILFGMVLASLRNLHLSVSLKTFLSLFAPVNDSMMAMTARPFAEEMQVISRLGVNTSTKDDTGNFTKSISVNPRNVSVINITVIDIAGIEETENAKLSKVKEPHINSHHVTNNSITLIPVAEKIAAFYNVYSSKENPGVALKVVEEQISKIGKSALAGAQINTTIYYLTLGQPLPEGFMDTLCQAKNLTCHHIRHQDRGSEEDTLAALYDYCGLHLNETVMYFHSKGTKSIFIDC